MASGAGIKESSDIVVPPDFKTIDLIAGIRTGEYFSFYSFRELYERNRLNKTLFLGSRNMKTKLNPDVISKINSANKFIEVSRGLVQSSIVKKMETYKIFGLDDYLEIPKRKVNDSATSSVEQIFRILRREDNKNKETSIDKSYLINSINSKRKNQNIFILRVISRNVLDKIGFVNPKDFKTFANYFVESSGNEFLSPIIKNTSLPRFVYFTALKSLFQNTGDIKLTENSVCYNVIKHNEKGDIALVKNLVYSNSLTVSENNSNLFEKSFKNRTECTAKNVSLGSIFFGYFKEGILFPLEKLILDKVDVEETDIFQNKFNNLDSKINLVKVKQFYNYPKKVLDVIILSKNIESPFLFDPTEFTESDFVDAFINTLSIKDSTREFTNLSNSEFILFSDFRIRLLQEFINYIDIVFKKKGALNMKKTNVISKIESSIGKIKGELKGARSTLDKSTFVKIFKDITGQKDDIVKAVKDFLATTELMYGVRGDNEYFEILRNISYFIFCEKEEACDELVKDDYGNVTFPFILGTVPVQEGPESTVFYNTKLKIFTSPRIKV